MAQGSHRGLRKKERLVEVVAFYPYLIDGEHEFWFMDQDLVLRQEDCIEWYTKTFDTRKDAESCLPALVDEYINTKGHLYEGIIGFGTVSVGGLKAPVTQEEFQKIVAAEPYVPYAEDGEGNRHFLDRFVALDGTTEPKRSWGFPTLDDAKRRLSYVHRTLFDDCAVEAFTRVGVEYLGEKVFSECRQLPLYTGKSDEFYLYVEGEQGRKFFYKETGIETFPTVDWGYAKKFSTAEDAKAAIPEFAKQPIISETPRDSRTFGVVNGVGELVFEEQADWYIPYVCAEYGADLFLCKDDQEGLTRDQNKAWGTSTVELALEKAKQIHRIAFDSGQALLGTSVGVNNRGELVDCDWSDLVASGEKSNLYFPYVLDTHDGRTYLLETSGTPHQWTQFLCDAQGYTNVEDAKNMIQRLVELVHEDCYFPEDLRVGVMNGYGNKFFEDAIVCPASVVDEPEVSDPVNSPEHYKTGGLEAIDVVEAFFADNYLRGNVFKYIARAGKKDPNKKVEDLQKAAWYLNREIESLKGDCA